MNCVVEGCFECPFHIITEHYQAKCMHPVYGNQGEELGDYQNPTPDDCPLKKDNLTIVFGSKD